MEYLITSNEYEKLTATWDGDRFITTTSAKRNNNWQVTSFTIFNPREAIDFASWVYMINDKFIKEGKNENI